METTIKDITPVKAPAIDTVCINTIRTLAMDAVERARSGHPGTPMALAPLLWIYDNNRITIEGRTSLTFSDDVAARFLSYHWNVRRVGDCNDLTLIEAALHTAHKETERPTLLILDSHIAWGAPAKQDTSAAHGEPLGAEEIRETKRRYGWPPDAQFLVPDEVRAHMSAVTSGGRAEDDFNARFAAYRQARPDAAREWDSLQTGRLPDAWDADLPVFPADAKGLAGRDASHRVLNAVARRIPWLLGGAADLAPSTKTSLTGERDVSAGDYAGRNVHFGVREHAMGAIVNGLALSKLRPYAAAFLIFSDYMRAAIRLSAIMDLPVLYIFTHDSIGVGEDGPTHQPIEQVMSLRAIPNLVVLRPADADEVTEAWRVALGCADRPVAMILSRQPLPTLDRTRYASAAGLHRGAYVLADGDGAPSVILLASGSEVSLCIAAYEALSRDGIAVRVVSMPSWEMFEQQSAEYQDAVLPRTVRARVAVEAGTSLGWREYVGLDGRIVARREFGASAPIKDLLREFGFTAEHVIAEARAVLQAATEGQQDA